MIGANRAAHTDARMDATTTRMVDMREKIVMIEQLWPYCDRMDERNSCKTDESFIPTLEL